MLGNSFNFDLRIIEYTFFTFQVEDVLSERKQKKGQSNNSTNGHNQKNADMLAREVRDLSLGEEPLEEQLDANEGEGGNGGNERSRGDGSEQSSSGQSSAPSTSGASSSVPNRPTLTEFLQENFEVRIIVPGYTYISSDAFYMCNEC